MGNQLFKVLNWLEVMGLVFLASVGQKMCFSRQNVSFRRSLNVLNCFNSDSNSGFSGLSGCGVSLRNYCMLQCRKKGSGFENLAEKFCFSLEICLFLSERYNFVPFRPTWGNLNWFLVIFLDVNRSVCIWKWVYTKSEPTGTSSSWFAICLNEVGFSLHFFFVFFCLISFTT